ncbi:DUF1571 domain-containing protein [Aeoliella mucimassa]|uniref:DUF1571 domain-containing protein n=1 Tax=Aeoliella mucimassa TaxID=2527972 RepID=A0A518ARC1_9BACT|nr:DUF1571 domain-containing protein [Aeoliella mucimassa]QDU57271.1 hypothetical protein Pan181_34860 [Aeoliella mucimassa]
MSAKLAPQHLTAILALLTAAPLLANAQEQRGTNITEPIFRVARETPAKPVSAHAISAEAMKAAADKEFFDLTQQAGEHPLAPAKRFAERVRDHIDTNVQDYKCLFIKMERIDGVMQDTSYIDMRVLQDPFAVHLVFRSPKKGQECLYVEGQNDNKLLARGNGMLSLAGVLHLDPNGTRAMDGNRHPITMAGISHLTDKMIEIANDDMRYGECEVKTYLDAKLDKRPTVMVEIIHPVPRKEFKFHKARIYVDKELRIPVRYEAYDWKQDKNGKPELTELYMYSQIKLNNGFTAANFKESDPAVFK